jgi:hypothetical protein
MPHPRRLLGQLVLPADTWPDLSSSFYDDILRGSGGESHIDIVCFFLRVLVTARIYKDNSRRHLMSSYVKPSLEAFLVLTYLNSYGSWIQTFEDENPELVEAGAHLDRTVWDPDEGDITAAYSGRDKLFTSAARGRGRHKGWSPAGLALHRQIAAVIKYQRGKGSAEIFDVRIRNALGHAQRHVVEGDDDVLEMLGADDAEDFFHDYGYDQHLVRNAAAV